jgi:hypothetical protein
VAIPAAGPLGISSSIVNEFGGSTPHAISEYYRGGSEVGDTPANAPISESGLIRLGMFYNASDVAASDSFVMTTGAGLLRNKKKAPNIGYRGFDGGSDFYGTDDPDDPDGSLDNNTYLDSDGNTKTITAVYQVITGTIDSMYFSITPANSPNTDVTFRQILLNVAGGGTPTAPEVTWVRADFNSYRANSDGGTHWRWPLPGSSFTFPVPAGALVPCRLDF